MGLTLPSKILQVSMTSARTRTLKGLSMSYLPAFVGSVGLPSFRFATHNILIMQALQMVEAGKINRLAVEMPPRHSKTELSSVQFSAWMLAKYPWMRIVLASYSRQLAILNSRRIRDIFREPAFRAVFPHVKLNEEKASEAEWETNFGGGVLAVGVGSGLTGRGANLIIVDDPVKGAEEARSAIIMEGIYQWFTTEVRTRLQPEERGLTPAILLVMTRWSPYDLTGRMLMLQKDNPRAERYGRLRLPALAEENDPLGRNPGEALWEESYPAQTLEGIRALDEQQFSALYQQDPRDRSAIHFDVGKIHVGSVDASGWSLCWSWDLAVTEKEDSDYTVGALVAGYRVDLPEDQRRVIEEAGLFHPVRIHVVEVVRQRARWPEQRKMIIETARKYPGVVHVIEETRVDLGSVQQLEDDLLALGERVETVRPKGDKISRKGNLETCVSLGLMSISQSDDWNAEFMKEFEFFPSYNHDDQVDVVEQALEYLGEPAPKLEMV